MLFAFRTTTNLGMIPSWQSFKTHPPPLPSAACLTPSSLSPINAPGSLSGSVRGVGGARGGGGGGGDSGRGSFAAEALSRGRSSRGPSPPPQGRQKRADWACHKVGQQRMFMRRDSLPPPCAADIRGAQSFLQQWRVEDVPERVDGAEKTSSRAGLSFYC